MSKTTAQPKRDTWPAMQWREFHRPTVFSQVCKSNAPRDLRGDSRVTVHADVGHFESESQPDKKGGE